MGLRLSIALVAVAQLFAVANASAQPDLPPPPPPPMGSPTDLPAPPSSPLPPPPAPAPSPSAPPTPSVPATPSASSQATRSSAAPRRALQPPAPAAAASTARAPRVHREVAPVAEGPPDRSMAVTANPVPLAFGRLSANFELLLAPHHAVVASPNALLFHADRGGPSNAVAQGFGFTTRTSASFGIELGYHYFWSEQPSLRGPFIGPSLIIGATTDASAGDATQIQIYWGVALDAGWQEVFAGGFTLGGGIGIGLIHLADATAVFPRFLIQVGWSF